MVPWSRVDVGSRGVVIGREEGKRKEGKEKKKRKRGRG